MILNMLQRFLIVLVLGLYGAMAATIDITWVLTRDRDKIQASAGDVLVFAWQGQHDLHLHPSGSCSTEGGTTQLVGVQDVGTYSYTIPQSLQGQTIGFACQQSLHCSNGLLQVVEIADECGNFPSSRAMGVTMVRTVAGRLRGTVSQWFGGNN